jgi:hypothetical protein
VAVAGLAAGVSNKVLVGFKVLPKLHKIMLRVCKSRNFIKYHSLQVVATWAGAADLARVVVAAASAKVAAAADSVKAAVDSAKAAVDSAKAAVDSAKVVVDSAKVVVDSAKAVAAVDLVRAAAVVDLVAGAKVAAGAKRSV